MIALETDRFRLTLDPVNGAAVRRFDMRDGGGDWQPVFLAVDPEDPGAGGSAMFAMLPFANRARHNRLVIGERHIPLAPNTADPLALHGQGWTSTWEVEQRAAAGAELSLSCDEQAPFPWAARQSFALRDNGLRVELHIENRGDLANPVGAGWHPYFPHRPGTRIAFNASAFWLEGPDHLPTDPIAVPPELSFSAPRPVPATWRNNCYQGWTGRAEIIQPELGYRLHLTACPALEHLMLYCPQSGVFALEPQSHVSGRSSVTEGGLWSVPPGRSVTLWAEFTLEAEPPVVPPD